MKHSDDKGAYKQIKYNIKTFLVCLIMTLRLSVYSSVTRSRHTLMSKIYLYMS